ncbi:MAG TPA: hypothetical protein VGQ02_10740 [Candidatus Limnocylindrales bacterium]|nr:hypothetical protein [Candidatus Limnocylindrales bacterium]
MPKLVLAASLLAALVLAACGSATPPPSQAVVSPPPASLAPSAPADPATPEPADPTAAPTAETPVATPAPTARPTPKPTPKPTPVAFNRAERYLIDGIMRGESDCSPVRGDRLPGLAIAGIDCDLIGSPVARMGYYLFRNDEDMLDAYVERTSAEGLVIDSGACAPGEGESAYIPYGEDEFGPDRHACFVNDEGYGNYRATLSGAHVYVGLLGRTANMRSLEDWAWFGNQDVPGTPTLWQQDFVYRP